MVEKVELQGVKAFQNTIRSALVKKINSACNFGDRRCMRNPCAECHNLEKGLE